MDECIHRAVAVVMECPGPSGPCKGTCWENLTGDSEGNIDIARGVKITFKRVSLSKGVPLGNMEGIGLTGLFQRKG